MENSMAVLQKLKLELLYNPAIPFLARTQKNWKRYLYTHIHGSISHSSQEADVIPQVFISGWVGQQWDISLKRRGILSHAITWMDLEDIMLSELKQLQKDKYSMVPLVSGP